MAARGTVLIGSLVVSFVLIIIAVALSHFASLTFHTTTDSTVDEQAQFLADAGLDYTIALLNTKSYDVDDLNGEHVVVELGNGVFDAILDSSRREIQSTGHINHRCRAVLAQYELLTGSLGSFYYIGSREQVPRVDVTCPALPPDQMLP